MGWLYRKEIKGQKVAAAIADYITGGRGGLRPVVTGGSDIEIAAIAVSGGAGYVAIRNTATGEVSAIVVLYDRDRARGEIGFKVIGEGEGPYYYGAPDRVLKALSPTTDPRANEWRAACKARNEKIARFKGDLTGRRIRLFDCASPFLIIGRAGPRSRSYHARREDSGVLYLIRPCNLQEADIIG